MLTIKVSEEMGRGVYVDGRSAVRAGQVLATCEIIVLSPIDTVKVNSTSLKYYTFAFAKNQDCLVLGIGELFNHDQSPNVSYTLERFENRFVMVFRATRDVMPGAQLFIDYSADAQVDVSQYLSQDSLVG